MSSPDLVKMKVYRDGSHYVALPYNPDNKSPFKPRHKDEAITIKKANEPPPLSEKRLDMLAEYIDNPDDIFTEGIEDELPYYEEFSINYDKENFSDGTVTTKRKLFDMIYDNNLAVAEDELRVHMWEHMREYFDSDDECISFMNFNFERKAHNLWQRKARCYRKARNFDWDYFATFTYDSKKHDEATFRKKLLKCLANKATRDDWRYIGVWERSSKERLHFHSLMVIPEGTLKDGLQEVKDYSTRQHKIQTTVQSPFFNDRFGRTDFKTIDPRCPEKALHYIMKYISKSGEKFVYSRGLYEYFEADVEKNDILTTCGQFDQKYVLYDKFKVWKDNKCLGEINDGLIKTLGKVS
jgi:hypothetical protein